MRHVGRHVRHFPRPELVAFAADPHAHPPGEDDENLLVRMRVLLRALARLEAQHADLDLLAGDEAAECGRVLRWDVLFLPRIELVDWHHAALLPCSPCEASLQVKKMQS